MRRKAAALVLIAAFCIAWFLLWPSHSFKQTLTDGTVLVLSGVKVGRTNVYSHGTKLSKTLGRLAPPTGIHVAGLNVRRPLRVVMDAPAGSEVLTAELWLGPGSPQETAFRSPPFYMNHRLLIYGDNDGSFPFVKEFDPFVKYDDGLFSWVKAGAYPRDSRRLHFRLEDRETNTTRNWREVATFVVPNPKGARVEPWKGESSVRLRLSDRLEVETGELVVRYEPFHVNGIEEYRAILPVRFFSNGHLATGWDIPGGNVRDASGNYASFNPQFVAYTSPGHTGGWTQYHIHRPLDPTKAWKFDVGFASRSNFSFTVSWPLTGAIQMNLGEVPVRIDSVNTDLLSVEVTNKPAALRLTFVNAVDDEGAQLYDGGGTWGQHRFSKSLHLPPGATSKPARIHATVAISEYYKAEFILQPRYERHPKP